MNELTKNGEDFRSNKKQVSNAHYYSFKLLCGLVIASVGYIVYKQNSETLEAGVMAIGGTSIMFAFLFGSDKAASSGTKLIGLFVFLWLGVEMFSAFGARVSVSNSHSLNQMREIKADAKAELTRLKSERVKIMSAGYSPGDEAALLAKNSRSIDKEKSESKLIIDSDEQKLHGDIEAMTGVSNVGSIRYGIMAALYIMGSSLLIKMSGGLYCNRSLKKHLKQSKETMEIMASCEPEKQEVIKTVSPEDLETSGTQEDKPKVVDMFNEQLEATRRWVERHPFNIELSTMEMRKATGTSKQTTQNQIIAELYDNDSGILTRVKKGNQWKYSRVKADSKQQALNVMGKTAKLFKPFKLVK
jgi:hypothetical protein